MRPACPAPRRPDPPSPKRAVHTQDSWQKSASEASSTVAGRAECRRRCPGRSATLRQRAGRRLRDLVFHCLSDSRRGPVALHTPATWPLRRIARVVPGDSLGPRHSCRGRRSPVRGRHPGACAQQRRLDADTRRRGHGPPPRPRGAPANGPTARKRWPGMRTGHPRRSAGPLPLDWSDRHYARAATGRLPLTAVERERLGDDADRFPLFGQSVRRSGSRVAVTGRPHRPSLTLCKGADRPARFSQPSGVVRDRRCRRGGVEHMRRSAQQLSPRTDLRHFLTTETPCRLASLP
ncbi:hypothetical protein HEP81_07826 [Streptomyces griseofuscus]|uniref:Uncharacterized protein n=1 Tax=Streptomyces griseofuscus TaxID=146922 RepID=A0A7H1QCM6_9ACTN|nr:hypothetical protein HEP81_07826 [Streptomyces griseofuscus]